MISVKPIKTEDTISIRHAVLRAGKPVETCYWEGDGDADTFHIGGFLDGEQVGVCTFMKVPFPGSDEPIYRLRGMAVLSDHWRAGVGALMLAAGEDRVRGLGVDHIWCEARLNAVPFYEKFGWEIVGERFDIHGIGPHYRMRKDLTKPYGCHSHSPGLEAVAHMS